MESLHTKGIVRYSKILQRITVSENNGYVNSKDTICIFPEFTEGGEQVIDANANRIVSSWNEYDQLKEENESLKKWKEEAISVMPDFQEIGKLLGINLGEKVSENIVPKITELKERNKQLEEAFGKILELPQTIGHAYQMQDIAKAALNNNKTNTNGK